MPIYTPFVNCSTCYGRVAEDQLPLHMAWHDNLLKTMKAANPLIALSLLNGL